MPDSRKGDTACDSGDIVIHNIPQLLDASRTNGQVRWSHPPRGPNLNDILVSLTRVVCLGVAIFSYITTRELVSFLILVGIAIDPSRVWDAIKLVTPKPHSAKKGLKRLEEIPDKRENKEEL